MAAENERTANPLWDSWIDTLKAAGSPVSAYASLVGAVARRGRQRLESDGR
jgi:hypothetical protein